MTPAAIAAAAPLGLAGRWALLLVTATTMHAPIVGRTQATTTSLSVHELRVQGDRLQGAGEICELQIDSGSRLVRMVVPQAFIRALPPPVLDAQLVTDESGLRLYQGRRTLVVGALLERPDQDPLPTAQDDGRVVDQDRDGRPGVTIRIEGLVRGEIYVVQRSWSALDGHADGPGSFSGPVRFHSEQRILGASSRLLRRAPLAAPDLSRSLFHLVRLPQGSGCQAARTIMRWRP